MAKQTTKNLTSASQQSNPTSPNQTQSSPRRRSSRVKKPIQSQPESNLNSDEEEEEENIPSSHSSNHYEKKSKKPIRARKTPIKKPKAKSTPNQNPKRQQAQENNDDHDEGVRSDRELGNQVKSDYIISQDNDLFNSIQKGSSAIEPTLEDWIEMYKGKDSKQTDSHEEARAEGIALLINCILRCCGCNNSIDKDEALDLDAVPERLDDIQEEFKKVPNHAYPLINSRINKSLKLKLTTKKNFEKNLINFFKTLINLSHQNSILYETDLMNSLQTYLVSMTTSSLRSIRHTSTFVCLFGLMSSFIEILIQVSLEFNQLNKKVLDLKSKNHHNNRSGADERLSEWEKRKSLVSDQKESLENHINDFFDGVFVHRYRDSDPKIRIECVQALGQWMNQLPDHFLGGHYLRYLGWVLTDTNKEARFEAMKALKNLYSKEDNLGPMQHFTTRFKSRFLEIAIGEPEINTRCLAIEILTIVDSHGGILESLQRNQLMKLIFDQESRVRKSISKFFKHFLNEVYDSKRIKIGTNSLKYNKKSKGSQNVGSSMENDQVEKGLKLKCLASLLIKFGKDGNISVKERKDRADDLSSSIQTEPEEEEEEATDDEGRNEGITGIGSLSEFPEKSRIALAIESLWDEIEAIRDWRSMSDYLLLDHSTVITNTMKNGRTSNSSENRRGSLMKTDEEEEEEEGEFESVEEGCKLTENEESVLLEIFLVTLSQSTELLTEEELSIKKDKLKKKRRRLKQKAKQKEGIITEEEDEGEDESEGDDEELDGIELIENSNKIEISKVMIKVLPKFYIKYCHDSIKLFEILRIPKLLSLNLYVELRMVSAYENLWDILINEYLKQKDQRTISIISSTINHLLNFSKSLSHINQKKIQTLNKSIFKNLLNLTINEEDRMIDLETCDFEIEEIDRFYFALIKVFYFFKTRDLSGFLLGIGNEDDDDDADGDQMMVDGSVKKQVAVDIIFGLANRGRLNYPEETKMVEVAIEILQLNFMWTCANSSKMINEVLGIEEEVEKKKKEVELKELLDKVLRFRDRFLDLMKEFAIDPDCIACDQIKRAAFIHMLNIYLISYGTLMPDQLRIDCDHQTQFRCAGFIAAEIERFGNEIKEKEYEKRRMRIDLDEDDEEDDEEEEVDARDKKGKGKEKEKKLSRSARQRIYQSTSFKEIKNQEEFELLITTFTKSICCGIIEFEHSNLILSNFNRFGDVFDLSIEILIGSLKGFCFGNEKEKEIQFERKKEKLAKTVSESFKESFGLFLNEEVDSEEQFLNVSKLLGSTIVIRGARLSIKSILNSRSYIILHQELIEWVFPRVVQFQEKDENQLDKFGIFFKGLVSLILGMDGRAALKIKSLIDLSLEKSGIEIPANSKSWDPYRTYIKRLISIMAKDPSIKRAAKLTLNRKADKNGAEAIEEEDEHVGVDDEAMDVGPSAEQGGGAGAGERLQSEIQDWSEEDSNDQQDTGNKKTSRPSAIAKGKARAISDDIRSDKEEEEEKESTPVENQSRSKRIGAVKEVTTQRKKQAVKPSKVSTKKPTTVKKGRMNEILESETSDGIITNQNSKTRSKSNQLECVLIPNHSPSPSNSVNPSSASFKQNRLKRKSSLISVLIPNSKRKRNQQNDDEEEENEESGGSKKQKVRNVKGKGKEVQRSDDQEQEQEQEDEDDNRSEISLAEVKRRARRATKK